MSIKRFLPLFVGLFLLVACGLPSAVTNTAAPPTPTVEPTIFALTPTSAIPPTETSQPLPPTDTPIPVQPPIGAPIAHLPAGQEIKITFIQMLDGDQGWAIGGLNGNSDHILRTSDGGLTWKDTTPPEPAPADPQTAKKAIGFFMDPQKAWVAFSGPDMVAPEAVYIWYTTDGGAIWNYSALTEPALHSEAYLPSDLSFVDAQHGWMMAHVGAGMNHDYYALLATSDGGATWQTLISPFADNSGTQGCYKSGLVFVTPQEGWMTVNCHGVVAIPYFFKTHDGGATWGESVNLPAPPAMPNLFDQNQGYCDMQPPTFFSPTSADLILDCVQYTNDVATKQSFLYETKDAGATWNVYAYPGGPLRFIDSSTAFALGRDLQRSEDAGHTWASVRAVNWDGQFSFIDAQTAWAVATDNGQIALVKSINGGSTWQEIKPKVAP